MNKKTIIIFWLILPSLLYAQKEDYNWVLGDIISPDSLFSTVVLDFNTNPVSIKPIYKSLGFDLVSSSLSDSAGQLLCFSNGNQISNRNFEIMENGMEIQPSEYFPFGLPLTQGMIMLPTNNRNQDYILLTGDMKTYTDNNGFAKVFLSPISYTTFNFRDGNVDGKVNARKTPILEDSITIHGGFSAVRHGNGRDWWLVLFKQRDKSNEYYKILIKNGKPEVYDFQGIGEKSHPGWDHSVFSPNGQWYIRYSWWGSTSDSHSSIYLYNFDRCSGALSNFQQYELKDNGPGGVAVSPNSRYLYVSNWDTIFQYDLQAKDIFATETVVAAYDGFRGEDGYPVRFFTPQLAPDGRIYLCVPNVSSRYLHYIEYPDSAGIACKVVQHGLKLPVYNSNTLPNMPYFRLYEAQGSPCDTIGRGKPEDFTNIQLQPNPGGNAVMLHLPGDGLPQSAWLRLYSASGALVLQTEIPPKTQDLPINTGALANGLYFYEIRLAGERIRQGKWVKD